MNVVKTFHFYNSYNTSQQHAVPTPKLIYYQFYFFAISALFLQLQYLCITYIYMWMYEQPLKIFTVIFVSPLVPILRNSDSIKCVWQGGWYFLSNIVYAEKKQWCKVGSEGRCWWTSMCIKLIFKVLLGFVKFLLILLNFTKFLKIWMFQIR